MQYQNYRVQIGDTLPKIVWRFFGSLDKLADIASLNKLERPYLLTIGQTLVIPTDDPAFLTASPDGTADGDLQEVVVTAKRDRPFPWLFLILAAGVLYLMSKRR